MTEVNSGSDASVPNTANQGIIYLLENDSFETPVIKIGKTGRTGNDLATRIRQLNTGVPLSFTCFRASLVENAVKIENLLHQVFQPAKKHWRGEFYEVEPWRVMLVLEQYEIQDMSSFAPAPSREDSASIDTTVQNKERKANATFSMLDIPIGAKLTFQGDSEIECEIANGQTGVTYEGTEYTLSALATQLKGTPYYVQGLRHWVYEEETLLQRRDRMLEQQGPHTSS